MTYVHILAEALIVGLIILGTVVLIDQIKQAIRENDDGENR